MTKMLYRKDLNNSNKYEADSRYFSESKETWHNVSMRSQVSMIISYADPLIGSPYLTPASRICSQISLQICCQIGSWICCQIGFAVKSDLTSAVGLDIGSDVTLVWNDCQAKETG